ncbi:DUF3750 domain-containing protein [Candidatus Nomurabacteria bacterium]|nr:DUF3750 domain-containing protein [Candidatus Nomurabacteria bacterium]
MTSEDLEKLIKKDKYQVFIFTCPCSIPINFAQHTWFVVNKKGVISRWEVLLRFFRKDFLNNKESYLYLDLMPKTEGMEVLPFKRGWYWKSKLLTTIEGDENSTARKMIDFIENSKNTYKYTNTYALRGPNSNTYIQWVLDHFPELKIRLPWNAFGKNFKIDATTSKDGSC